MDKNPQYNYHFNREEFEKSRFTEAKQYKDGPFKRNRTLLITLLDISVIVLILLVVIPFVRKSYEIPDLEGYRLNLSRYISGEDLFLNLSITNKTDAEVRGAGIVKLEFKIDDSNSDIISMSELLPLPGETLTYRAKFNNNGSETATVKVTINDTSSLLRVKLLDSD